ncbi:MAG TPA: hypothetical protein VFM14_07535 [Gemmatimonadales bacterium]|nr:hypothetical protein [Gemmatimonadales bacterium]
MDLAAAARRHLSPEEGTLLSRLADQPDAVMWFTPASSSKPDYQRFNAEVVWPLEQLKLRGLVAITDRKAADAGAADTFWEAVAAALTAAGRQALAGSVSSAPEAWDD